MWAHAPRLPSLDFWIVLAITLAPWIKLWGRRATPACPFIAHDVSACALLYPCRSTRHVLLPARASASVVPGKHRSRVTTVPFCPANHLFISGVKIMGRVLHIIEYSFN